MNWKYQAWEQNEFLFSVSFGPLSVCSVRLKHRKIVRM